MIHPTYSKWLVLLAPLGYILLAVVFLGTIWVGATYSECQARAVEQADIEYAEAYNPYRDRDLYDPNLIIHIRPVDKWTVDARNARIKALTGACMANQAGIDAGHLSP